MPATGVMGPPVQSSARRRSDVGVGPPPKYTNRNQQWYQKLCRLGSEDRGLEAREDNPPASAGIMDVNSPQRIHLQLHLQREYIKQQELQKNCCQDWWRKHSGSSADAGGGGSLNMSLPATPTTPLFSHAPTPAPSPAIPTYSNRSFDQASFQSRSFDQFPFQNRSFDPGMYNPNSSFDHSTLLNSSWDPQRSGVYAGVPHYPAESVFLHSAPKQQQQQQQHLAAPQQRGVASMLAARPGLGPVKKVLTEREQQLLQRLRELGQVESAIHGGYNPGLANYVYSAAAAAPGRGLDSVNGNAVPPQQQMGVPYPPQQPHVPDNREKAAIAERERQLLELMMKAEQRLQQQQEQQMAAAAQKQQTELQREILLQLLRKQNLLERRQQEAAAARAAAAAAQRNASFKESFNHQADLANSRTRRNSTPLKQVRHLVRSAATETDLPEVFPDDVRPKKGFEDPKNGNAADYKKGFYEGQEGSRDSKNQNLHDDGFELKRRRGSFTGGSRQSVSGGRKDGHGTSGHGTHGAQESAANGEAAPYMNGHIGDEEGYGKGSKQEETTAPRPADSAYKSSTAGNKPEAVVNGMRESEDAWETSNKKTSWNQANSSAGKTSFDEQDQDSNTQKSSASTNSPEGIKQNQQEQGKESKKASRSFTRQSPREQRGGPPAHKAHDNLASSRGGADASKPPPSGRSSRPPLPPRSPTRERGWRRSQQGQRDLNRSGTSTGKRDSSLTKHDTSLTKNDTSLTKNDTSLTKNDTSLTKNDTSLTRQESATESDKPHTDQEASKAKEDAAAASTTLDQPGPENGVSAVPHSAASEDRESSSGKSDAAVAKPDTASAKNETSSVKSSAAKTDLTASSVGQSKSSSASSKGGSSTTDKKLPRSSEVSKKADPKSPGSQRGGGASGTNRSPGNTSVSSKASSNESTSPSSRTSSGNEQRPPGSGRRNRRFRRQWSRDKPDGNGAGPAPTPERTTRDRPHPYADSGNGAGPAPTPERTTRDRPHPYADSGNRYGPSPRHGDPGRGDWDQRGRRRPYPNSWDDSRGDPVAKRRAGGQYDDSGPLNRSWRSKSEFGSRGRMEAQQHVELQSATSRHVNGLPYEGSSISSKHQMKTSDHPPSSSAEHHHHVKFVLPPTVLPPTDVKGDHPSVRRLPPKRPVSPPPKRPISPPPKRHISPPPKPPRNAPHGYNNRGGKSGAALGESTRQPQRGSSVLQAKLNGQEKERENTDSRDESRKTAAKSLIANQTSSATAESESANAAKSTCTPVDESRKPASETAPSHSSSSKESQEVLDNHNDADGSLIASQPGSSEEEVNNNVRPQQPEPSAGLYVDEQGNKAGDNNQQSEASLHQEPASETTPACKDQVLAHQDEVAACSATIEKGSGAGESGVTTDLEAPESQNAEESFPSDSAKDSQRSDAVEGNGILNDGSIDQHTTGAGDIGEEAAATTEHSEIFPDKADESADTKSEQENSQSETISANAATKEETENRSLDNSEKLAAPPDEHSGKDRSWEAKPEVLNVTSADAKSSVKAVTEPKPSSSFEARSPEKIAALISDPSGRPGELKHVLAVLATLKSRDDPDEVDVVEKDATSCGPIVTSECESVPPYTSEGKSLPRTPNTSPQATGNRDGSSVEEGKVEARDSGDAAAAASDVFDDEESHEDIIRRRQEHRCWGFTERELKQVQAHLFLPPAQQVSSRVLVTWKREGEEGPGGVDNHFCGSLFARDLLTANGIL